MTDLYQHLGQPVDDVAAVNAVADGLRAVLPGLDLGGLLNSEIEELAGSAVAAYVAVGAAPPTEATGLRANQCNQLCHDLERGNAALADELAGLRAQIGAAAEAGITRDVLALRSRRDIVNLAVAQAGQVRLLQQALGEAEARAAQLRTELVDAAAAERARLLGSEDLDADPDGVARGVLDHYVLGITDQVIGPRAIYARCSRGCGAQRAGTILLTARSLDTSLPVRQNGLTIAELAHQALRHEADDHPAEREAAKTPADAATTAAT